MRLYFWFRALVSDLFVPRLSRAPRRRERRQYGFESLETRAVFASYSLTGTTLNIDLNSANERVQVYANGTQYVFLTSGSWTGSGTGMSHTGNTMSASDLSAFNTVNITDSAANTTVIFETGTNGTFSDNFNINLDNLSNSVVFNGTNTFNGTNSLSVTIDSRAEVPSAKSLTMTDGNLDMSINMQATPQTLPFSGLIVNNGTIQTTGMGQTTIAARGGNGIASSFFNKGVAVVGGGKISGGTSGTLSITGYGYNNLSIDSNTKMYGQGVFVSGINAANTISQITSLGANVAVTGYGANDTTANLAAINANAITNAGVAVGCQTITTSIAAYGLITSGGSGTVTVTGYGGSLANQPVAPDTSQMSKTSLALGVLVYGQNTTITSGGAGLVNVQGFGGGAAANTACGTGVVVFHGASINSGTNGSVVVCGTGCTTADARGQTGVYMYGSLATATIAAGPGTGGTSVSGNGGGCGTNGCQSYGVYLNSNATITAVGSGDVTVTGRGGTSPAGTIVGVNMFGSNQYDATISSGGGNVVVTGYGGEASGPGTNLGGACGVFIQAGSFITAGGTGNVTVTGIGGNNNATAGNTNSGVSLTIGGNQKSAFITSSGGNVTVIGTGGGGNADSPATSNSAFNTGVAVLQGAYISAGGSGTVNVTGQGGGRSPGANGSGSNNGVYVCGTNLSTTYNANGLFAYISSSGGAVTVTGSGGGGSGSANASTSTNNHGVYVRDGGCITSGGNADVQVNGTGGGFGSSSGGTQYGVLVEQVKTFTTPADSPIFRSTITSGGNGSVTIQGQGGGVGNSASNIGLRLASGAIITSGGSGDVTVNGTGGNPNGGSGVGNNAGVNLMTLSTNNLPPTITSGGGNITVTGTAGGQGSSTNHGVNISSGGLITAPANASVSVTGRGGNLNGTSGSDNYGVNVTGMSNGVRSSITSNNGTVVVTGYGGQTNTTVSSSSANNTGVYVSTGACISSGGSFPVTVTGFGGGLGTGSQSFNYGVGLQMLYTPGNLTPQITSAGGTVTVNGTGGGTNGNGNTNYGVSIQLGGQITSAGNGTAVNVIGTGGSGTQTNHGVYIAGCTTVSNLTISSNNGPITITGTAGAGGQGVAGCTTLATVVGDSTTPGNVTIIADSVALSTHNNSTVHAAERLIITPLTAGVAIDLGGTGGAPAGPLTLSQSELAKLNAPTIQLGNATTGNVTLTSGVTFPTASNVTLHSNGTNTVLSATACATQGMTLGAGKTLDVSTLPIIASAIGGTSLGIGYTQLKVVGDLSIAGKTLSLSGAYTPAAGNVFTIVNATNLTGTFTGLNDGSTVTFNGKTLIVNYTATNVTLTEPSPLITTNPSSSTVTAGLTASFTAAASGIPTPTVQWQVSTNSGSTWSDITGATNTTYSFTTAIADDGKLYRAVFTNSYGTTTTAHAALTVQAAPAITTHPSDQTVNPGDTVNFTAAATGSPAPTVKWQVSTDNGSGWTDIAGATSTTYSFTAAFSDDTYQYRAVFTNSINSATTSAATLIVNSAAVAPAVTGNPANSTVTAGSTASFTASAWGNPAPSVKWQLSTNSGTSWSDIAGATSTTYSFTAAAGDNGNQYRAVFTNGVGSDATTTAATLTVQVAPTITSGNTATFAAGLTESFQVVATGSPAASYSITAGSLPSGITLNPTTGVLAGKAVLGTAGSYAVTITANNGIGTPATQAFTLTVVNQLSNVQISRGQVQRSYLRYIDLAMVNSSVATQLAASASTRIKLVKRDLNGNNPSDMSLTGLVSASGSNVTIDFGAQGIGGARNTNLADGYYTLQVDLDNDGTYETSYNFFRLFGDTNGDGKVDQTDVNNVTAGMTAYSVEYDLNFDGRVNSSDLVYVRRALNRTINPSLPLG